jgi:YD repeat-containing protein
MLAATLVTATAADGLDHRYDAYGRLVARVVNGARVDYRALASSRPELDAIAAAFDAPETKDLPQWPTAEQMAFWINAYNVFTLRAIVDHYPIRAPWFTIGPRNSIRQIDGVWTTLTWRAAGRDVTLDDIEHKILRPAFKDPRVHMAINCASVGCPPLSAEPYVAARLDAQLDAASRRYLASPQGTRIDGDRLKVSSIFKWYGEDFGTPADRAVLAFVARFGPPAAAELAASGRARLAFLDYDWSLNDTALLPRQTPQ